MSIRDLHKEDIKAKGEHIREKAHQVGDNLQGSLPSPGTMTGTGHSFFQGLQSFLSGGSISGFNPARALSIIPKGFSLPAFGAVLILLGGVVAAIVAFFKFKK